MAMTEQQYLLNRVAEECAEVAQRALKAAAFGLLETQDDAAQGTHDNPQRLDNLQRLQAEYVDLIAVMELLGVYVGELGREGIYRKKAKVAKYMLYAREMGMLE